MPALRSAPYGLHHVRGSIGDDALMIATVWAWRSAAGLAALVMATALLPGMACAGALDRIRQDNQIRIAYRADAPPFSYKGDNDEPAGFVVDLCQAVVKQLAQQLNLPSLKISYATVTAVDRFEAIQQSKADLLCEPTSSTLSRRKLVDFSVTTFVDGAGIMITPNGPNNLQELSGRTIGVLAGTTTEQELRNSLNRAGIAANVALAKTHARGTRDAGGWEDLRLLRRSVDLDGTHCEQQVA